VTTWTNFRSCVKGQEGVDGLKIAWRQGFAYDKTSGPTHPGMGAFGSGGFRSRIHFARIYGEPEAFGLLGRQDYVFMEHQTTKGQPEGSHKFNMRVWKNIGSGGAKPKGQ